MAVRRKQIVRHRMVRVVCIVTIVWMTTLTHYAGLFGQSSSSAAKLKAKKKNMKWLRTNSWTRSLAIRMQQYDYCYLWRSDFSNRSIAHAFMLLFVCLVVGRWIVVKVGRFLFRRTIQRLFFSALILYAMFGVHATVSMPFRITMDSKHLRTIEQRDRSNPFQFGLAKKKNVSRSA